MLYSDSRTEVVEYEICVVTSTMSVKTTVVTVWVYL